jgi:hypothetical protein
MSMEDLLVPSDEASHQALAGEVRWWPGVFAR